MGDEQLAPRRVPRRLDDVQAREARHVPERTAADGAALDAARSFELRAWGGAGVVAVTPLKRRLEQQQLRPLFAQGQQTGRVVDMQMGERDASQPGDRGAELIGRGRERDDRLRRIQEFDRRAERERRLPIHSGVDQEEASVLPFERKGGMAHRVGRVGRRIEVWLEHSGARHLLPRGIEQRERYRQIGRRPIREDRIDFGQRRCKRPDREVRPQQDPAGHDQCEDNQGTEDDEELLHQGTDSSTVLPSTAMGRRLSSSLFWAFLAGSSIMLFPGAVVLWAVTAPFDPRLRALHQYTCFWGSLYTWFNPAWPVTVTGREKIRRDATYVIVANHQSLLDILVLFRLFEPLQVGLQDRELPDSP